MGCSEDFLTFIRFASRRAGRPLARLQVAGAGMAGVPARTIQGLARHATLAVTMGYMHLSPSALDDGIAIERWRADQRQAPVLGS